MDPMAMLALACAAFVVTHFVSSTPLRPALAGAIGEKGYLVVYTLVSFAMLGWMAWAYGRAPLTAPLFPGLRWLPLLALPLVFALLTCGLFTRNPTLVGSEHLLRRPNAAHGILRVTRHPVMWALMLWAIVHILARGGDRKALLFFGTFVVVAGLGTILMDRRKADKMGTDWAKFAAVTSNVPFVAILQGRNRFKGDEIGLHTPAIGVGLYALFFWAHPFIFRAYPY